MLVLTRKLREAIVVNEEIKVTILEVRGKTVRLGIEAPPHISVHRDEVFRRLFEASPTTE